MQRPWDGRCTNKRERVDIDTMGGERSPSYNTSRSGGNINRW